MRAGGLQGDRTTDSMQIGVMRGVRDSGVLRLSTNMI
jgi:hypothetical protein